MLENFIVVLIIFAAAIYLLRKVFMPKNNGCGCGCSGCGDSPAKESCCSSEQNEIYPSRDDAEK